MPARPLLPRTQEHVYNKRHSISNDATRPALPDRFPRDESFRGHETDNDPLASMAVIAGMSGRVLFDEWREKLNSNKALSDTDLDDLIRAIEHEAMLRPK